MVPEALLDGQAEALTQKAIQMALDGDPVAMRIRAEIARWPCHERKSGAVTGKHGRVKGGGHPQAKWLKRQQI